MSSDRINVRIDAELKDALDAEARSRGVSPSAVVREALRGHLRRRAPRETALDLAIRLGSVGAAKGLPADLSTNPKHMEGFGGG